MPHHTWCHLHIVHPNESCATGTEGDISPDILRHYTVFKSENFRSTKQSLKLFFGLKDIVVSEEQRIIRYRNQAHTVRGKIVK